MRRSPIILVLVCSYCFVPSWAQNHVGNSNFASPTIETQTPATSATTASKRNSAIKAQNRQKRFSATRPVVATIEPMHEVGRPSPSPSKAAVASLAATDPSDPYSELLKLPYAQSLMNANLATIRLVDSAHPDGPKLLQYEGHGVRAEDYVTGIAGTKYLPLGTTGNAKPAVSIVQDLHILGNNDDFQECLVQSTISFPFAANSTESHAVTHCNQPPNLTSAISGYVIDQVETGALIAAANAMGKQFDQTPYPIIMLQDQLLFPEFDKALRTTLGDDINGALSTASPQIPVQITTGDLMSPFMVFSISAADKVKRTMDIQFDSVGFSTFIKVLDPGGDHRILFGTAITVQASGKAHITETGVDLNLTYKFNLGTGLVPLAPKFQSQINGALIPKFEGFLKTFFPPKLNVMLFLAGNVPLSESQLKPLSVPPAGRPSSLRWSDSPDSKPSLLSPQ